MFGDSSRQTRLHLENERRNPQIAPHSCPFCQQIIVAVRGKLTTEKTGLTLSDVFAAALEGCLLGKHLIECDGGLFFERSVRNGSRGPSSLRDAALPAIVARNAHHDIRIMQPVRSQRQGGGYICTLRFRREAGLETVAFSLYAIPGHCQYPRFAQKILPPNLFPDSELSYLRARQALRHCESLHEECRSYHKPSSPKRLLEISDDRLLVRLTERTEPVRYAAFSYCWGGDQPSKTTTERLPVYMKALPLDSLSASIRDAITVTRELHMSFLWVDALCIVQDNEGDKIDQIAAMHQVYRGATVTIAAAAVASSTDGFLHPRIAFQPILFKACDENGEACTVIGSPEQRDPDTWEPLFNRAWSYQETHLTTRLLIFGQKSVVFRCIESGGSSPRRGYTFTDPGCRSFTAAAHPLSWQLLLERYSPLELSVSTDRLLAVAALAEEYEQRYPVTRYYAGLWHEDLVPQLLWYSHTTRRIEKPTMYCGPSWSWCSVIGAIYFPKTHAERFTQKCTIESIEVDLQSKLHPYGRVDAGRLTMTGRIKSVAVRVLDDLVDNNSSDEDDDSQREAKESATELLEESGGADDRDVHARCVDPSLHIYFDAKIMWPINTVIELRAIELVHEYEFHEEDQQEHLTGCRAIVLEEVESSTHLRTFRRVGTMLAQPRQSLLAPSWFDTDASRSTVVIV